MQKIHKINKEKNFKKNWVDFDRGWIVIMHLFFFFFKYIFIRYRRYMNKGGAGRMTFDENEYDYEY